MASKSKTAPIRFVPERLENPPRRSTLDRSGVDTERKTIPPTAKIEILEQGGYRRPVITRGGAHVRGRFRSRKTGLTQVFEGNGEPWFAMRNEVDAQVLDFQCHPFRMYVIVKGKRRTYRPDAIRLLSSGRIQLVEVKRTEKDLEDPDYRDLMDQVQEIVSECGWEFQVIYRQDILPNEHSRENIETLYGRVFGKLSSQDLNTCRAAQADARSIRWADLRERFAASDPRDGDWMIETACAQGLFWFDLDAERTDGTLLYPVTPKHRHGTIRF